MKRIKLKESDRLKTREDVEKCLQSIAIETATKMATTGRMDATLAQIRAEFEGPLARCDEIIAHGIERLRAWAEANPDEFSKCRSIKFQNGTIGFRTGNPQLAQINKLWTWKNITEAVAGLLPAFIRNKPEVDREAIIAHRDEEALQYALPRCGLKVIQDESFYVEPNVTKVETRQTT